MMQTSMIKHNSQWNSLSSWVVEQKLLSRNLNSEGDWLLTPPWTGKQLTICIADLTWILYRVLTTWTNLQAVVLSKSIHIPTLFSYTLRPPPPVIQPKVLYVWTARTCLLGLGASRLKWFHPCAFSLSADSLMSLTAGTGTSPIAAAGGTTVCLEPQPSYAGFPSRWDLCATAGAWRSGVRD